MSFKLQFGIPPPIPMFSNPYSGISLPPPPPPPEVNFGIFKNYFNFLIFFQIIYINLGNRTIIFCRNWLLKLLHRHRQSSCLKFRHHPMAPTTKRSNLTLQPYHQQWNQNQCMNFAKKLIIYHFCRIFNRKSIPMLPMHWGKMSMDAYTILTQVGEGNSLFLSII